MTLAQDFGELDVPDFVFSNEEELGSLREAAAEFKSRLLAGELLAPDAFKTFRYNLQIMDRKRDAVSALIRSTFVPTISDWQALTLPAPLYPLYYLFRVFRLLKKYSGARLGKAAGAKAEPASVL